MIRLAHAKLNCERWLSDQLEDCEPAFKAVEKAVEQLEAAMQMIDEEADAEQRMLNAEREA
jgi:hypothetical protein